MSNIKRSRGTSKFLLLFVLVVGFSLGYAVQTFYSVEVHVCAKP
jgi:flagellar basal body-associated protein FliL